MSKWDQRSKQNKGNTITAGEAIETIQNLLGTAQMAKNLRVDGTPDEQTLLAMVQSTMIMMAAQTARIFMPQNPQVAAPESAEAPASESTVAPEVSV